MRCAWLECSKSTDVAFASSQSHVKFSQLTSSARSPLSMADHNTNVLDADVRLAWRRFRGKATTDQMLRWLNHHLRRGYAAKTFEAHLAELRSQSEIVGEPAAATQEDQQVNQPAGLSRSI